MFWTIKHDVYKKKMYKEILGNIYSDSMTKIHTFSFIIFLSRLNVLYDMPNASMPNKR